jgi:hypothetical protein
MQDRIVKDLRVVLSEAEHLAKGQLLAKSAFDMSELEAGKATAAASYARQIKDLKRVQGRLSYDVQTGTEVRPVECEERRRFEALAVDIIRLDTGEVIDTRAMTHDECQLKFGELVEPEFEPDPELEPSTQQH